MGDVQLRAATERDAAAVAEIVHGAPGREPVALLGGEAPARRLGLAVARLQARAGGLRRTILAEADGLPVGALQWRVGGEPPLDLSAELAWATLRALGAWGALRTWRRDQARRRVTPEPPPGAFHVEEIHVRPAFRGRGIGALLLEHAEAIARREGFPALSLITHAENPAQRLYRRAGFREVARREDPTYRRLTGIPGRLLMVKPLEG